MDDFSTTLQQGLDEVKKYASELRAEAQGDFDFITKFLDQQHRIALGSDDQARANFFEQVANEVESRVGRIPFDFQRRTDREKRDLSDFLRRQEVEKQDIQDQQRIFEAQQRLAQEKEQRGIKEQANVRGMLGSGIEKRQQQEAAQERELFVQQPATRQFALSRLLNQMQTERGQLESGRAMEDITTEARRGAMDTQNEITQRRESAKRTLEQQLADIRRQENQATRETRRILGEREQLNQFNV